MTADIGLGLSVVATALWSGVQAVNAEARANSDTFFGGLAARFTECGLDPETTLAQQWCSMAEQLMGFPRHLSQHPGGFVIAQGKLSRLVPIENATMAERSVTAFNREYRFPNLQVFADRNRV